MVAISHMWLFKVKINENLKCRHLVALGKVQVLNNHVWLVATVLDSEDIGHYHNHSKFNWMAIFESMGIFLELVQNLDES